MLTGQKPLLLQRRMDSFDDRVILLGGRRGLHMGGQGSLTLMGDVAPTVELRLQAVVTRETTLYGPCASSGEYPSAST